MPNVTPVWTDTPVPVVAVAVLARGLVLRGTLDLRAKHGGYVMARVGRGGTTALTNGVDVLVRRTLGNEAKFHPGPVAQFLSEVVAGNSTTVNADSASGTSTLNVASTTGFAAGDVVLVQDAGGGVTRAEWVRVSKVTDATHLALDDVLKFTHTAAQADTVRNKGNAFPPVWLAGGATHEVIFDYGDDAAGESVTVEALAQTYDSDLIA